MKVEKLPRWTDFSEQQVVSTGDKLDRAYIRKNDFIAVCGIKTLTDFARFTSHEDQSIDRLEFAGKERLYLTGLKRRAVMRRASESILRGLAPEGLHYPCATPDHQCMACYNCYLYGGLRTANPNKGLRARIKTVTAFSKASYRDCVTDEPEFHIMVHRNLSMHQEESERSASIYELDLIKPGTVFSFVDIIFHPSRLDLALYFETIFRADKEGYGSRSSLYGTMTTDVWKIFMNWAPSQEELLAAESSADLAPERESVPGIEPEALREELPSLIGELLDAKGTKSVFGVE